MTSAAPSTTWRLYLDESGHFDDPGAPVCVAGLLVRDDVPGTTLADAKAALHPVVPGFPWPWHAALINQPAWLAFLLVRRASLSPRCAAEISGPVLEAATAVVACMEHHDPRAAAALADGASRGQPPEFAVIDTCSRLARQQRREATAVLEQVIRKAWAAVGRFGAAMAKVAPSAGTFPSAVLVAASETRTGDAVPEGCSDSRTIDSERYLHLLAVVIQRAAALLARLPDPQRLFLHVLERHVLDPRNRGRGHLRPPHVRAVIDTVAAMLPASVKVDVAEVASFGPQAGIRYVLADFIANRGRRWLDAAGDPLDRVEQRMASDLRLAARSGHPARSHLAASGEALRILGWNAAGVGPGADPPAAAPAPGLGARRCWAIEQAEQWADAP